MTPATTKSVAHVFTDTLDDVVTVSGEDGHHLGRALRVRVGETVTAADGVASWRPYRVAVVAGAEITLEALGASVVVAKPEPGLACAFALTKGAKPETTIAHLTELGADRILPIAMAHSIVRWDERKAAAAHARFVAIAREAAMQSRRIALPTVEPVQPFRALLSHPALVVGDAGTVHARGLLADLAGPVGGEWCAVTGPEGGFAPDERAALSAASPYPPVAIGPYVLRAETAALALATLLAALR